MNLLAEGVTDVAGLDNAGGLVLAHQDGHHSAGTGERGTDQADLLVHAFREVSGYLDVVAWRSVAFQACALAASSQL